MIYLVLWETRNEGLNFMVAKYTNEKSYGLYTTF